MTPNPRKTIPTGAGETRILFAAAFLFKIKELAAPFRQRVSLRSRIWLSEPSEKPLEQPPQSPLALDLAVQGRSATTYGAETGCLRQLYFGVSTQI